MNEKGILTELESYQIKSIHKAISFLFDELEERLLKNEFYICEEFLKNIDVELYSFKILISILAITHPWKEELKNREDFLNRVISHVKEKYTEREALGILSGIE